MSLRMNPQGYPCGRCGLPAIGWAFINGQRYCHEGSSPTCYELNELDLVEGTPGALLSAALEALRPKERAGDA